MKYLLLVAAMLPIVGEASCLRSPKQTITMEAYDCKIITIDSSTHKKRNPEGYKSAEGVLVSGKIINNEIDWGGMKPYDYGGFKKEGDTIPVMLIDAEDSYCNGFRFTRVKKKYVIRNLCCDMPKKSGICLVPSTFAVVDEISL